eukprot:c4599_g1_i1 orf=481-1005(+)
MPGPKTLPRSSNSVVRCSKINKSDCFPACFTDSDNFKHRKLFCGKKVRVICTDPDATDSSSDDEERLVPKRLVREIFFPTDFSISSDYDNEDEGARFLRVFTTNFVGKDVSSESISINRPLNCCSNKSWVGKKSAETSKQPVKKGNRGAYEKAAFRRVSGAKSCKNRGVRQRRW